MTTDDKIKLLDDGEELDVSLRGNGMRSSKTAGKVADGVYSITHDINDSETFFTTEAMREVLDGDRSPWDGNVDGADF